MRTTDVILFIGLGVALCVFIADLYFKKRFLNDLRTHFTDQWVELGKPTLFWNNSMQNQWAVFIYLWQRKYLALNDATFSQRCEGTRTFSLIAVASGFAWIGLVLAVILISKQ